MQHIVKFIEEQIFLQITGKNFLVSFKVKNLLRRIVATQILE